MLRHPGHVAKPIAGKETDRYPRYCADYVVQNEFGIRHRTDSGNEWRKRAHDRHEPGEDNRLAAVLLEKRMGSLKMFRIEKPGFFPSKHFRPKVMADPIVGGVAQNGRRRQ